MISAAEELLSKAGAQRFRTVLADPPWRFQNKTGKVAPGYCTGVGKAILANMTPERLERALRASRAALCASPADQR